LIKNSDVFWSLFKESVWWFGKIIVTVRAEILINAYVRMVKKWLKFVNLIVPIWNSTFIIDKSPCNCHVIKCSSIRPQLPKLKSWLWLLIS